MTDQPLQPDFLAPHSVEAEEALLGAILINPEAMVDVIAFLRGDDFFILRNSWVWEAMTRLNERGEAIDNLTVIEELRNQGRLEDAGGGAYITYLINNTPTSLHAEVYGRIIERAAIRRRILEAAGQIAQLASTEDADINEVVDRSEATLFAVTGRNTKKDIVPLHEAITDYYDRIEALYLQQEDPHGVPTGFAGIDKLLGGLQKSDLVILAARPGMGKTSLILNIALNAARYGHSRVAVFSLEMSKEQLVQRLVSSETGINTQQLRLGQISESEWDRFVHATGKLGELPIFLDDTPAISPMQMRGKCRRLYREHGLDLVIVDYLQLMSSMGVARRSENRVQEVSAISRNLKELARELNVPVIAASQLSRAVEQRGDKRPVLSDLRESGCLAGNTQVTMSNNGARVPIRDLAGRSDFTVWALNEKTMKLERAAVSRAFSTGVKPIFRMTTRSGRTIRATGNHKFLTIKGWKRLDELQFGDHIATPRVIHSTDAQTMSNLELALLGHLIGDGCTLPRHAIQYTTHEEDLAEIVMSLSIKVFPGQLNTRIQQERSWYQVYLSASNHLTHNTRNPVAAWLDELSAFGLRSYEKRIPEAVFQQNLEGIKVFIRHLWATDGCIRMVAGKSPHPAIYYATSSEGLAFDLQSLLLRLGINARLRRVPQKDKGRDQFHLIISGKAEIELFIKEIGAVGQHKQGGLEDIVRYIENRPANTNRDIIPREIWHLYVKPAMKVNGLTSRQMQERIGTAYCGTALFKQNVSRERALIVAHAVRCDTLAQLSESDIYWDSIVAIDPDGEEEVFDLTVPGPHNFVANDIIAHNSIEQDADVVMFIYRDEVYNEDTERPNQADIMIAKHRNGPIGTIALYFRKELTQFANLKQTDVDLSGY